MPKEKFLYYLGAGASATVLPLAKGLPSGLREMAKDLENNGIPMNSPNEIVRSLNYLASKADDFGDVDTYAKYLFLLKDPFFEELKRTLDFFFVQVQTIRNRHDQRYLSWLVSIMDKDLFPSNVKIVTWNYDLQFHIAARNFFAPDDPQLPILADGLIKSFPFIGQQPFADEELSLIQLNGTAGLYIDKDGIKNTVFREHLIYDSPKNHLSTFAPRPCLSFAWEKLTMSNTWLTKIRAMIQEATIVVVIGYSFPFFNREVDQAILGILKLGKKLRKIYFQDPVLDGQQLRAQFNLDKSVEIIHISNCDRFYVPYEY